MPESSEFSRSAYTKFASEQLNATRTAIAMCAAASRGDMTSWLKLLTTVEPAFLVMAMSKVARSAIETLADALDTPIEDMYEELVMSLAMSTPDEM